MVLAIIKVPLVLALLDLHDKVIQEELLLVLMEVVVVGRVPLVLRKMTILTQATVDRVVRQTLLAQLYFLPVVVVVAIGLKEEYVAMVVSVVEALAVRQIVTLNRKLVGKV